MRRRLGKPAGLAAAALAAILLSGCAINQNKNDNSANVNGASTGGGSSGGASSGGSSGGAAGGVAGGHPLAAGSSAKLGSNYALEYQDVQFTLPGGDCGKGGMVNPSGVDFKSNGPAAWTAPNEVWGDMTLACGRGDDPDGFYFSNDRTRVAVATKGADPVQCQADIDHDPATTPIRFADIHEGMGLCVTGNSSDNQLIYVKAVSVNASTFTTKWSASAWVKPVKQ